MLNADIEIKREKLLSNAGRKTYDKYFTQKIIDGTNGLRKIDEAKPNLEVIIHKEPKREIRVENHNYNPNVDDILDYFDEKGVVGEEKLKILGTFCLTNNLSFGVEGYSGSGKTFFVDKLLDLVYKSTMHKVELSSDMAIFNQAEDINGKLLVYIPELQKAMKKRDAPIIEVIKNLTEGRDASRAVTIKHKSVEEFIIKSGITIVYTLAYENEFKKDTETARRFIVFNTDTSEEHIKKILEYKAQQRIKKDTVRKENQKELSNYIMESMYLRKLDFIDPFALAVNEYVPINPKSVGFVNHYHNLLNASAKFHRKERISDDNSVFLSIQDHYLLNILYYNEFCDTISFISGQEVKPKEFEWQLFFEDGVKVMQEKYPKLIEKWLGNEVKDGQVIVYNPLKKKDIVIAEYNPLR